MKETDVKFQYPRSLLDLESVNNFNQLKDVLSLKYQEESILKSSIHYKISKKKQKYLYANCSYKGCLSCLRYTMGVNGKYILTKAVTQHNHQLLQARKIRFEAAKAYINSLPCSIPPCSLRYSVCKQFNLSQKQFYYLLRTCRYKLPNIDDFIKEIESRGYQVYLSEENRTTGQLPQILLAFSPQMKQAYQQYGDMVSFDLTFNMVKNIHTSGSRWKVGCFLGTSSAKHLVPFGFAATLYENKESYIKIFRTFIQAMGKSPPVIITDQQRAIKAALSYLKQQNEFAGVHLLDGFHILRNVKKRLKTKQHLFFFSRLLHAKNLSQFGEWVDNAKRELEPIEKPVLESFIERSQLYCFSKIQPCFFGFSASSSPNEALHSLLKSIQPTEKDFVYTMQTVLQYLSHLHQRAQLFQLEKTPYEDIFNCTELRAARHMLCKPVLSKLIEQFSRSIACQIIGLEDEGSRSNSVYIKEKNEIFRVNLVQQGWKCQCLFHQKVGLPCCHLLRFLTIKKLSILPYLSQRWILKGSAQERQYQNHGAFANVPNIKKGRERSSGKSIRRFCKK